MLTNLKYTSNTKKLIYMMNKRNPSCDDFIEALQELERSLPLVEYTLCELIYNHLDSNYTNAECNRYLQEIIRINDEQIDYSELDDCHRIESIFFCAMKLNISAEVLCKKKLAIPKECIKDYMQDYKNFVKIYNNKKNLNVRVK